MTATFAKYFSAGRAFGLRELRGAYSQLADRAPAFFEILLRIRAAAAEALVFASLSLVVALFGLVLAGFAASLVQQCQPLFSVSFHSLPFPVYHESHLRV
jgi:hypothetical protein